MDSTASHVTDHHLALMRAYSALLQRIGRLSWLIWIPAGPFGLGIPVLTMGLRVLASSHIRRVLGALDRTYLQRLAFEERSPNGDDWKKLHEQVKSMDAGLPPFVFAKWVIAILAFACVFLAARSLPHGDLIVKMAIAVLTLNPGKLAELSTDADGPDAFLRLVFVVLFGYIVLTPILIYHFRLKRALLNHPLLQTAPRLDTNFKTVWRERSVSAASIYVMERNVFAGLGNAVVPELPLDLLSVAIAFVYHALGPGMLVGILAWQIYSKNVPVGRMLFSVASINCLIGFGAALTYLSKMRQRSKELASA